MNVLEAQQRSSYYEAYERETTLFMQRCDTMPEDDYEGRFKMVVGADHRWRSGSLFSVHDARRRLIKQFSFAVPCEEALAALEALGPIVEMGAGSGYWAYRLRKRGVDVQAYDKAPGIKNEYEFSRQWTGVLEGRPGKLKKRSDRALFLCWPSYNIDFASNCLRRYTGDTVVYVGEGGYGCTGDAAFHETLEKEWTLVKEVRLPQWPGINDDLMIYRRGGS